MAVVTMRQLLESGVHFGHQTRRWNPKMKRFIMTERNGIYIIDLQQSLAYIDRSYAFIKETVAKGGSLVPSIAHGMAVPSAVEGAMKDVVSQFWNDDKMTSAAAMDRLVAAAKTK